MFVTDTLKKTAIAVAAPLFLCCAGFLSCAVAVLLTSALCTARAPERPATYDTASIAD